MSARTMAERITGDPTTAARIEELLARLSEDDELPVLAKLDEYRTVAGGTIAGDALIRAVVVARDRVLDDHHGENGAQLRPMTTPLPRNPETPDFCAVVLPPRHLTDSGNGLRLVDHYGANLRHAGDLGLLVWDGQRWARDNTREVARLAGATAWKIYDEARDEPDEERRKALAKHAVRSESRRAVFDMIELAKSDGRIQARPEDFDRDPAMLCVANGVVDLRTGTLRPHRREDLMMRMTPIEYDPDEECPRFENFLCEVFDENDDVVDFVQRAAGYSLTGSVEEHALLLCHGSGMNGKTTLLTVLEKLAGEYGMHAEPELLLERRHDGGPRSGVAQLHGARLVVAMETGQGKRLNVPLVKWITGGDTLRGAFLYHDSFQFTPTHTLWLATNHKPVVDETTDAIWRRIYLIPFNVSFKGRADRALLAKLDEEMPGILSWAVRGAVDWYKRGLDAPDTVNAATEQYRTEEDPLAAFLAERCVFEPDAEVPASALRTAYTAWCAESSEEQQTAKAVGQRLRDMGCTRTKGGNRTWRGVRLNLPE